VGVAQRGISVIGTSDRKIKTTVKVGDYPVALAITPDGSKLYSLNIKDQQAIFSVIETRRDRIVDSFRIELECSI
jgi:DNA-binding beta-propeller fold protein YncE